jgi:Bacterial Ig-like domain (group 2)
MSSRATLLALASALLVAACGGEPLTPDRCNIRLASISPDPATLEVGQAVTLEARLASSSCLPADARPDQLRWRSDDPGVAAIDAVTGRVTAVGAGTAQVTLLTAVTQTLLTQSSVVVGGR